MGTVGLVGAGRMGSAIAHALRAAGHDLVVWNRTHDASARLAGELGGRAVDHPKDVAAAADVSISMLADRDAVDAGFGATDLDRARPVLEAYGSTIFHLGPLGSGAAMKLAVNTVIFGLNQALAEGLVLAERAGIPRERAYDVLAASAVGAPFVGYKRAAFLDPDGTAAAFTAGLAAKDLRLIGELA